jgi:flagellar hook-associated protein 3 FlgL
MRVTFNSFRDQAVNELNADAATQVQLQGQIASGQQISTPDQNPLAAEEILGLQTTSGQLQQYYQNANYANNVSTAVYNAVNSLQQISNSVGNLVTGINGLSTPELYNTSATQTNALIEQAISAVNQQFNGQYLFGGTKTDTPPLTVVRDAAGDVTSVSYNGAAQGASVQIAEGTSLSPFPDGTTNSQLANFINNLVATRDAFTSGTASNVSAQQQPLQDSENDILGLVGGIGAQQKQIQLMQSTMTARYNSVTSNLSQLNDVDLAQATVGLTKSQTAYQAALQSTAKIMSQSLLNYL